MSTIKKRTFVSLLRCTIVNECVTICLHAHCITPPVLDARLLNVIHREQCLRTLAITTQRNVNIKEIKKMNQPDGHVYCIPVLITVLC